MSLATEPYSGKSLPSSGTSSGKQTARPFPHLGLGPGAEPKPFRHRISKGFETEVPRQHRRGSAGFEPAHEFHLRPKRLMSLATEPYSGKSSPSSGASSGNQKARHFPHLGLGPGAEPKAFSGKISAAFETEVPRQHRRGSARFEPTHEFRMRPKAHVLSH